MTERVPRASSDVATRVIEAVAEREAVDPKALEQPLDDVVDPDALDALFAHRPNGQPRKGGTVQFTYLGYEIRIDTDGRVTVEASAD